MPHTYGQLIINSKKLNGKLIREQVPDITEFKVQLSY